MIGSALGGFVQDRLGRRLSLISSCIVSAIAVALCFICDTPSSFDGRRSFFTGAKLLQGIAIGQLVVTTQTYMSEILPPKLRGPVLALFPISILLGQMIGAIVLNSQIHVPGHRAYRTCFASQWAFSASVLVASIFLPESPTWLIRKGNYEAALKAQKKLDKSHVDSQANIDLLRRSIAAEQETTRSSTYLDCFRGTDLRRTMIVAFVNIIPALFGLVLLAKASYFLQVAGMKPSDSTLFLIVGIAIGLAANIGSIWTLNICGRRPLTLVGLMIISLLWLGMGISAVFPGAFSVWWIAGSMMATIFVAGLSCWPASYVVSSETSSLHLRAKTQGVGWVTSTFWTCVFTVILPYIYNPDSGNLQGKTCFLFVGCCWIAAVLTWFYVPEMKGRTAVEIDQMFCRRIPTRGFKSWRADEVTAGQIGETYRSTPA